MMHSRIFDAILHEVPQDARIEDVSVGIFWTCVRTKYGCAISATAHRWQDDPPGAIIPFAGDLVGMRVADVAPLYDAPSLTARSLANAAVSASFAPDVMTGTVDYGNAQSLILTRCAGRPHHIALVGHFHFGDELRAMGHRVDIFELPERCGDGDIPNTEIPARLGDAEIVMMTSSTLITHATEDILRHCAYGAYRLIVGPTVPVHPVLWDFGFDAVCCGRVTDPEQVLRATRQGANHRQLTGCIKLNYLRSDV